MITMIIFTALSLQISCQPTIGFQNAQFFRTGLSDAFSSVSDQSDLLNFLTNELADMLFMPEGTIMNTNFVGNTTQVFLSMRGA